MSPPSLPSPPSFADFKFAAIGQGTQLLKRIASSSPDYRPSPTPSQTDLQYPSRSGTPWAPQSPTQPSLQQRMDSSRLQQRLDSAPLQQRTDNTDYQPPLFPKGPYLPMDLIDDSEKKPVANSRSPITSFQPSMTSVSQGNNNNSTTGPSSELNHGSPNMSLLDHPASSSTGPNTHFISTPPPSSSLSQPSPMTIDHQSKGGASTILTTSPWTLPFESAVTAFEKARKNLATAQEAYDAAKSSLTAITLAQQTFHPSLTNSFSQYSQSSDIRTTNASSSAFHHNQQRTGAAEHTAGGTPISGPSHQTVYTARHPSAPPAELSSSRDRLNAMLVEKQALNRRMTELEREADDVRRAWSTDKGERPSDVSSQGVTGSVPPSGDPYSPSIQQSPLVERPSPGSIYPTGNNINDGSSRSIRTTPAPVADRLTVSPSFRISATPATDRSTLFSISSTPGPDNAVPIPHAVLTSRTSAPPTRPSPLNNNSDDHPTPKVAIPSSPSASLSRLTLKQEDIVSDEDLIDHASPRGSSDEDLSNEMEVEKELGRERSVAFSSPTTTPSSVTPVDQLQASETDVLNPNVTRHGVNGNLSRSVNGKSVKMEVEEVEDVALKEVDVEVEEADVEKTPAPASAFAVPSPTLQLFSAVGQQDRPKVTPRSLSAIPPAQEPNTERPQVPKPAALLSPNSHKPAGEIIFTRPSEHQVSIPKERPIIRRPTQSKDDSNAAGTSSLLQRMQPISTDARPVEKSKAPSPPSLGKRRFLDNAASMPPPPPKRRNVPYNHDIEPDVTDDPPAFLSRISTSPNTIVKRTAESHHSPKDNFRYHPSKYNTASRDRQFNQAEQSTAPPPGPRVNRQTDYRSSAEKYQQFAENSVPTLDKPLSDGPPYRHKTYVRKKPYQETVSSASGFDRSAGNIGRGGKNLGNHRLNTPFPEWDPHAEENTTHQTFNGFERRGGQELRNLLDRMSDPDP